ncbi:MAG: hypothetical protein ACE5KO_03190 [Candidatus Bathyarchaeia archaeon]
MRPGLVFMDRDYVRTRDDLIFCVLGNVHPKDRVIAYLKYVPSTEGTWGSGTRRYKRVIPIYTVPAIQQTLEYLKENFPYYLFSDQTIGALFSAVPRELVLDHYCPELELAKLRGREDLDVLQSSALRLAQYLSYESSVAPSNFGVTGSILLGIHNPAMSDVDLVVYGKAPSHDVKWAMLRLYKSNSMIKGLEQSGEDWRRFKIETRGITAAQADFLSSRTWNRGIFEGRWYSIHAIRSTDERQRAYEELLFEPLEAVEAEVTISSDSEAIFLPSIYEVANVKMNKGPEIRSILQLVSYDGLYTDVFGVGDVLKVMGLLEKVHDRKSHKHYHRILHGSTQIEGKDNIALSNL